jgi:hypothetical protein
VGWGSHESLGQATRQGIELRIRTIEENLTLLARWYDRFIDVAAVKTNYAVRIWLLLLTALVLAITALSANMT